MGKMKKEETPAQIVMEQVTGIKKNERVLIIANPETNVIAQELFTAAADLGAKPSLIYQQKKAGTDAAEDTVIGAIKSEPDVVISVSAGKMGKDVQAIASPYEADGVKYDHIFDYLLDGKKTIRGVWTPGVTVDMFNRTVPIDYKLLGERCRDICAKYENAVSVHVTSPSGTDIYIPVRGRKPMEDNGNFTQKGTGGNVPAGEVFISPVVGTGSKTVTVEETVKKGLKDILDLFKGKPGVKNEAKGDIEGAAVLNQQEKENSEQAPETEAASENEKTAAQDINNFGSCGRIVFDGSIALSGEDLLIKTPVSCDVINGFVTDISGGEEAKKLLKDITSAEKQALELESTGGLPQGMGSVYAKNARNIGELGIGLNPAANITGNMLEDEKAFRTCHFAIGMNYDGDAPSLIHFDGVVRNPTIVIKYEDETEYTLLDNGELKL